MNRREILAVGASFAAWPLWQHSTRRGSSSEDGASPRRFELGIVTYNIAAQWDLGTILRVCASVGIRAVELRTTHRHGVEPDLPAAERREIRARFADSGIVLWGLGTVCEFHSPDPETVQRNVETCKRFLQLSADLGAKGVKVRPNALPRDVPVEKTLEQIGRAVRECGQAASELNQEVWVEVHGAGTAHPPHMRKIMEHCGLPNVGITWNSNPTDVKDGSIKPYFDLLQPWIKSCHINELYSNYPWRELFQGLRQVGYDRYTLAEIPGTPDVATGERLLRYYKALWQELSAA